VARQGKKEFGADDSRCTQNTQMVRRGSPDVGHAFDLQARLAGIKWQAVLPVGRFEIIGALHPTPHVLSPVNAQPIMRPDRSFRRSLSACSACISFLHLR
jgi:hypothetical protein